MNGWNGTRAISSLDSSGVAPRTRAARSDHQMEKNDKRKRVQLLLTGNDSDPFLGLQKIFRFPRNNSSDFRGLAGSDLTKLNHISTRSLIDNSF